MSFLLVFGQTAPVLANPTGGSVAAGSVTITSAGNTLTINQSTAAAIINWQQFSISGGQLTKFLVPGSTSATLNRVLGGNPSLIYGTLQSNGIVYLINPSGIVVGPSGRIDTAGFIGSTLDITDDEFLQGGSLNFVGGSNAGIVNKGVINASSGDVYLIAAQVTNNGTINAPQGNVGLGAGSNILYQPVGQQHLFIQSNPTGTTKAVGVTNTGTIRAATAELRAAGGNAYALAINNTGSIAATGYQKVNGQVYLTSAGGNISNSGKVAAQNSDGSGGTIDVDGSGATSGTVTNSGTLNASATVAGAAGGTVKLLNFGGTTVNAGEILAEGGTGGAGGSIETSGATVHIGGLINAGAGGTWLIDPVVSPTDDLTIDGVAAGTIDSALDGNTDVTEVTTVSGANGYGTSSVGTGDIDVDAAILWNTAATLTLSAYDNVNVNASITSTGGGAVVLHADNAGRGTGTVNFTNSAVVSTSGPVTIYYNPSNPLGTVAGTVNAMEYTTPTDFSGDVTGESSLTAYMLVNNVYDLQNMQNNLAGDYALGTSIDATPTSDSITWPGGADGFDPVGNSSTPYTGIFNGLGNTIGNLYIDQPSMDTVGLFGTVSGAIIQNVELSGAQIVGEIDVGALVGLIENGTVVNLCSSNSTSTVSDNGNYGWVGGLIGYNNDSLIANSQSAATVSSGFVAGGLLGENYPMTLVTPTLVEYSSSSGSVSSSAVGGSGYAGGLVGGNFGDISNSYSTASVSSPSSFAGGLSATLEAGTISNSYSTGVVTGVTVGGFSGGYPEYYNTGTISDSYWTTDTYGTGATQGVGTDSSFPGVTGVLTANLETAVESVWDFVNIWTTSGGPPPQLRVVPITITYPAPPASSTPPPTSPTASTSPSSSPSGPASPPDQNNTQSQLTPQSGALTPQLPTAPAAPSDNGNGNTDQSGDNGGALANSSGASGSVGSGDAAQLNDGQLNNVANPAASSELNQALSPLILGNLTDALQDNGGFDAGAPPGGNDNGTDNGKGNTTEQDVTVGGVVELGGGTVQNVPPDQIPQPLKDALNSNALQNVGH